MNLYTLIYPNNAVQPASFVLNLVTGILFMNKSDYTTYFGDVIEYKHGIQTFPLTLFFVFHLSKILCGDRIGSKIIQYHH